LFSRAPRISICWGVSVFVLSHKGTQMNTDARQSAHRCRKSLYRCSCPARTPAGC
jgi:hypothetical protein